MLSGGRHSRGSASLEFAMVAPIMLMLTLFSLDCARAFLIWREIHNAAIAIAENAGKLSVTTDPTTNAVTSELTYDQMQQAMSTIFADIPGLNLGNGGGLFPGQFSVTLSSIWFWPLCQTATITGCTTQQTPYVRWSTTLNAAYVGAGPQLVAGTARQCQKAALTQVAAFPDNSTQYQDMIAPSLAPGGNALLTAPPQIVADVQYQFVPFSPLFFFAQTTFYASAAVPAPVGGLDQTTEINTTAATGNVSSCPYN